MYSVTVPIIGRTVTKENRADFLRLLKKAEAECVFIATDDEEDPALRREALEHLRQTVAYFKENGLSAAIWLGCTIGHGGTLLGSYDSKNADGTQMLTDLSGKELFGTHCPLDKKFQEHMGEVVARYADLGAELILLDDDYRLSQHSDEPCCACEYHMARIREYCGEPITREELRELAFRGGKNKYRGAWLRAQGESLRELACAIREGVDRVNPDIPVAVCSAHCSWDIDGADPIEITDILAGKNKKLLRLHGAPYWAFLSGRPLSTVCEIERMFASFLAERPDIEIIAEGDVYPRPRFNVPASYLEIMDGALRADGSYNGILKYMINYNDHPMTEKGYIDRHAYDLPKLRGIERIFKCGANAGVRILARPHLLEDSQLDISVLRQRSPYPDAGALLSMCGIPTVYKGEGICSALFGENARHFSDEYYKKGVMLDAVSAMILTDMGTDVGLCAAGELKDIAFDRISDSVSGCSDTVHKARATVLQGSFNKGIRPVLTVDGAQGEQTLAYCYENKEGQRFLVFTLAADRLQNYPTFLRSYEVQAMLLRELRWLSSKPLPAVVEGEIEVYTLCEKGEDYTAVALFDCYADNLLDPVITLDREYAHLECIDCTGHIEGKKVVLEQPIPAYGFAAFKAYS